MRNFYKRCAGTFFGGLVAVSFLWTLVCIALILIFLGNVVWTGRKEKPAAKAKAKAGAQETSFRTLFYTGICWIAAGLPMGYEMQQPAYFGFFAAGVFFAALGLSKRAEWKTEKKWGELPADVRKFRTMVNAAALLLAAAGVFAAVMAG